MYALFQESVPRKALHWARHQLCPAQDLHGGQRRLGILPPAPEEQRDAVQDLRQANNHQLTHN